MVYHFFFFFFFNDTATTEIYTLSLHDALPISRPAGRRRKSAGSPAASAHPQGLGRKDAQRDVSVAGDPAGDRKSTRLNSSHGYISYAVFCLKKKKKINRKIPINDVLNARLRTV